jgi:hypothetical protein
LLAFHTYSRSRCSDYLAFSFCTSALYGAGGQHHDPPPHCQPLTTRVGVAYDADAGTLMFVRVRRFRSAEPVFEPIAFGAAPVISGVRGPRQLFALRCMPNVTSTEGSLLQAGLGAAGSGTAARQLLRTAPQAPYRAAGWPRYLPFAVRACGARYMLRSDIA